MGRKHRLWFALLALVAIVIAIQFIPVSRENPPVRADVAAPPEAQAILRRACYDCHSHETEWPGYSRVAPVSWLIADDVRDGRERLNFSVWNLDPRARAKKLEEIADEVRENKMPILSYRLVHPDARLSAQERAILVAWATRGGVGEAAGEEHERERGEDEDRREVAMTAPTTAFDIPRPLQAEHEELHTELAKLTKEAGRIGDAARGVAKVLHAHFVAEEEFALPPLGLLSALAQGRIEPEMKSATAMTDRLKAELPKMLEEHKTIVAALETLRTAASAENRPEVARFAEALILHAQTEEDVFYPTAIVIGEFLKLKL